MQNLNLFEFKQLIRKNSIILSFEGEFSQGILRNLVETLKEKLSMDEGNISDDRKFFIARNVYSIFIELAQNIQHYSSEKVQINDVEVGTGIIVLVERDDHFIIRSGNMIKEEEVKALVKHCDYINTLDKKGLKKFYKERLMQPMDENKIGAGLGLIQITRKSENPLEYNFSEIEEGKKFFELAVRVNKEMSHG